MKHLWIVQPYVPRYRVPFFEQLTDSLSADGVTLHVAAGQPDGVQAARGDAVSPNWLTPVESRNIGPAVTTRSWHLVKKADAVIYPHMGTWLELNRALIRRSSRRGPKVGVWGHVASYVSDPHPADAFIERWQLRHADHVFAYSPGGARFAESVGVDPTRVTVLNNTIDTAGLQEAIAETSVAAVDAFQAQVGLTPGKTIAYIGGLDDSKRIDLLADALDILWDADRQVRLIVGGQGTSAGLLERSRARGQSIMLGYVGDSEKALISQSASLLVNPGRIGLIAVESLVMKLPILTIPNSFHAPEVEYLQTGATLFVADESPQSFARSVLQFLEHGHEDRQSTPIPTMTQMVKSFRQGVLQHLINRGN